MTDQPPQELVRARASIHLPGLPLGRRATVDISEPYVADALKRGYLVAETSPVGTSAEREPEDA